MTHYNAQTLRAAVGTHCFYHIVAQMDPANADSWERMVDVQHTFFLGESGYDEKTRTYSESMRHTLHWALVFIFEDPTLLEEANFESGGLLDYFVELHAAAFKANGACDLGFINSFWVVWNTHWSMRFNPVVWWDLGTGVVHEHDYPVARRAAEHVRALRAEQGKPTADSGYRSSPEPAARQTPFA